MTYAETQSCSPTYLEFENGSIAVDIDDTLYSFRDASIQVLSEMAFDPRLTKEDQEKCHQAIYTQWGQWRTPYDILGDLWIEAIDTVHDHEMIRKQIPFAGAVDTLNIIYNQGIEILYISNRATETYEATLDWLADNEFPLESEDNLICTSDNKSSYISHCQYLVDDRVRTVVNFITENPARVAFGLMRDYNHNLTDVPGVYLAPTWIGIQHLMRKVGLI